MTQITYTERDNVVRITITGHALFSNTNDVVCAGISAITYQLLNYIALLQLEGKIEDGADEVRDGWVICTFRLKPGTKEEWDIAWRVIKMGFQNIREAYPENLCMD